MQPTLPIEKSGYTLHIISISSRQHIARLVRPDGQVSGEWMRICHKWLLKHNVAQLRDSIEASLGYDDTLPVYYATSVASDRELAWSVPSPDSVLMLAQQVGQQQ